MVALAFVASLNAIACATDSDSDGSAYDEFLSQYFKADEPGAAVLVTKDGKAVFRKAYGMANLEHHIPLRPEMVFRLGSLTKQITAAAIFLLQEQGKLSLADDIGKYLPEFSNPQATITIEHLLTHSSGIPGYTESPKFDEISSLEMSVPSIVGLIKELPPDFAPGTNFAYSNSGYFLLGAIIEQASGVSYAEFLDRSIFQPLGMKNTSYDSNDKVVSNRASGYTIVDGEIRNARYVSMSVPYSAGSLRSSVDDLRVWNSAMASGKLLKRSSWEKMFAPYRLANGVVVPFPFGSVRKEVQGVAAIDHGGRISGFVANGVWLPQGNVYVAILSNCDSADATPSFLAQNLAAIAIGKPYPVNRPVSLSVEVLDRLVGVYKIDEGNSRYVTREQGRLFIERTGAKKTEIVPTSATEFFYPNQFARVKFVVGDDGQALQMVMMQNGTEQTTPRISRSPRVSITLSPAMLDRLVGEYELGPELVFTVTRAGDKLMAQITGQNKLEVFAKSETRFFYRAVEAELEFSSFEQGHATKLTLIQNGEESSCPRR